VLLLALAAVGGAASAQAPRAETRVRGCSVALEARERDSPAWDADAGRPREGAAEAFVGDLLRSEPLVVEPLGLDAARFRVGGVEKVRVDGPPGARAPVDAILWLRVGPPR
jgi:hypothetical protein